MFRDININLPFLFRLGFDCFFSFFFSFVVFILSFFLMTFLPHFVPLEENQQVSTIASIGWGGGKQLINLWFD